MGVQEEEESSGSSESIGQNGDLPGVLSNTLRSRQETHDVYGDHVHQNDGTHLHGGITDDTVWQKHWEALLYTQVNCTMCQREKWEKNTLRLWTDC